MKNFQVSEVLYKYQLIKRIGGGNFGQVWLAKDVTVEAEVAVKILDDDNQPIISHLQEAKFGHHVKHENVVRVHYADVISHDSGNLVIIAMDHHPQGSVISELNSSNYLDIRRTVKIITDVLKGLEYLHECGIYHNDIKPSNILISVTGNGLLTDYGISTSSHDLKPVQSPNSYKLHAAPETIQSNSISVHTDIYQLGLTFYRLINGIGCIRDIRSKIGEYEFNKAKIEGVVVNNKDFLPFVPLNIKKIILRAISPDFKQRYQSALEMRKDLEKVALFGYWTVDDSGVEVGKLNNYTYVIEQTKKNGKTEFMPYKISNMGRKTKVLKRSEICKTPKQLEKVKGKFMLDLVLGDI